MTVAPQPEDEDEDGEEEEEGDDGKGQCASSGPWSAYLSDDDLDDSLSFLLPVHTDLCAGLNCHVTFLVVDACSNVAAALAISSAGSGVTPWTNPGVVITLVVAATVTVVTLLLRLLPPMVAPSSSSSSSSNSGSTSGSVTSWNWSQLGSAVGGRFGRMGPDEGLLLAPRTLEEGRWGYESEASESQSLSPARDPQPSTDMSAAPEPELSESESLH